MTQSKVWLQLVNPRGEALTLADRVDCAKDATVSRLLDAVQTKNAGNHLSKFAPCDVVVVYANRAAFDEKQSPLARDAAVGTCGSSESDALVVVVPDRQKSVLGLGSVEALGEMIESRVRNVMEKREKKKRSAYWLSDLDTERGERILKKMRLERDDLYFDEPVGTPCCGLNC